MTTSIGNLPALWSGRQQGKVPVRLNDSTTAASPELFSLDLHSVLFEFGPFPPYSLIVGQCLDGLPFMLSLDNPKSGSILLVGEQDRQKSQILKTMGVSSCHINHSGEIGWSLITRKPHCYGDIANSPNCQHVISPHDRAAGELVIEMASTLEQRRFGREHGRTQVLMIDDFQSFLPVLSDYSVYLNLKTLVTKGPSRGIWPLISIRSEEANTERGQLLRSFGTYIFEKVGRGSAAYAPTNTPPASAPTFQPDFNVIVGGRLIPIYSFSD